MLFSFLAASFAPELLAGVQAGAAQLAADDNSLAAERLRGIVLSHRDWVFAAGGRTRLRAQWRELFGHFDAVICPVMPTPAYPHDHSEDQETRRIDIDGKAYPYLDQMAWPGIATLPRPARHRDPDRAITGRIADRRADRRPLAGRPNPAQAG
jgi:amidase